MSDKARRQLVKALRLLQQTGMHLNLPLNASTTSEDELGDLRARIKHIVRLVNDSAKKASSMIFFVMYDIENDKVRRYVAKYLQRKGCVRIQKSVFLAEGERKAYDEIAATLLEVQQAYDNKDSLFVVPVSTDQINAMKIIWQGFDRDFFANPPNTIFI